MTKQIKCPQQSHLLRRFSENATGFWDKRGTRLSWFLSGILLLTILLNLATSYGMNVWTRGIFDALQEKDSHTILSLALVYLPLLAASVIFSVLPGLADWTASARRVALLQIALDELERAKIGRVGRINRCEGKGAALRLRDLSVTFDDWTLVAGAEVAIMPGEKVLVTGESGSGKSTLVRALAGLWPWGGGDIEMPAGAKLILLPQRAYVPSGTLRRAANYPEAADSRSVEEVAKVLKKVGLGHLIEHLDEERPWDQILSGGEKQRLAFARIFLHRPDIIVLDEATAALDSQSEDRLMELLSQEFKHATVVSVGHRSELEALHGRKIVLQRGRRGAKLVSDVYRIPKPVLPSGRPSMGLLSLWNSSLAHRTFRQAEPASRM